VSVPVAVPQINETRNPVPGSVLQKNFGFGSSFGNQTWFQFWVTPTRTNS